MISKLLVAIDGSEQAWKCLEFAVELAGQTGSEVTLLTVMDRDSFLSSSVREIPVGGQIIEPVDDYLRQVAEEIVGAAEEYSRGKGVRTRTVIRKGQPVEEIIREAEESKADLVAMGSRGKGALEASFVGSATLAMVRREDRFPILIVRS